MAPLVDNNSKKQLSVLAGTLLLWFLLYHETLFSMAEIWWRSETFAHGFLIFPISIYLIWRKREHFYLTEKKFNFFFAACLLLLVIIWALAKSVDVLVVQQLMAVLMIPAIVASLFGFKLLKQYLFPLFYLLFSVPLGEFLIPRLQEMTAYMTVFGLELTGIPVYTEGLFISIPSGDFEVAVACSGVRYLIASLALGTLYAYLTYSKWYKQIIFVAASLVVPVIANGLRAYGIVLIAHLSGMKYATGVDHLIYGWLFFGIVIFILFYVGSFWRDNDMTDTTIVDKNKAVDNDKPGLSISISKTTSGLKKISFSVVITLLTGPLLNHWMTYQPAQKMMAKEQIPDVNSPWGNANNKPHNWMPSFKNTDDEIKTIYRNKKNTEEVFFYSSYYQFEDQNKELVNSANEIFRKEKWVVISRHSVKVKVNNVEFSLNEYNLIGNNENLLIWDWYNVLGKILTHPIKIKVMQSLGKITGKSRGGRFVAIATNHNDEKSIATKRLKNFLQSNPQIILEKRE